MSENSKPTESKYISEYFDWLEKRVKIEKQIGDAARKKGYDPTEIVEIKLAKTMAERVVGLISSVAPQLVGTGAVERIVDFEKKYGAQDWRVAFEIAVEIAQEKFCKFESKKEAIEIGIRMGFAYVTVGVVSSPLEGLQDIDIKKRADGKEYFCLNFSGPIRNAGGTAASVSVLLADYVRKKMGYDVWDPTEDEVKRAYTEVFDYHENVTNLQYKPYKEELEFLVKNMPLEISGAQTDPIEVSNFKDLPRIPTNFIRGGMCLIYSSCIPLKAPKLWKRLAKWGHEMDMQQWDFLDEFIHIQKEMKSKGGGEKKEDKKEESKEKIKPNFTFIADLVAGRPVFGHPLKGFRLRYGRTRLSGYSAQAIHPATMHIMNDFIAIGTQLKVERPGKAASYTPCDVLEAPTILLNNGDVVQIKDEKQAKELKNDVHKILYNGDILINYGDFFNRAHVLVPPGYCEEWWVQDFEKALKEKYGDNYLSLFPQEIKGLQLSNDENLNSDKLKNLISNFFYEIPSPSLAIKISELLNIPLHPRYNLFWREISREQLLTFIDWLYQAKYIRDDNNKIKRMVLIKQNNDKEILEKLGLEHKVHNNEYFLIDKNWAFILIKIFEIGKRKFEETLKIMNDNPNDSTLEILNKISHLKIKDRVGVFIGARMGRPEKAKMRKMQGSPHGLFPVGEQGGKIRSFQNSLKEGFVEADFPNFKCPNCGNLTVFSICEKCESKTSKLKNCSICGIFEGDKCPNPHQESDRANTLLYSKQRIDIRKYFDYCLKKMDTSIYPDLIKGVRGTVSKNHDTEHLLKTILRAKHGVFVNKDGTVRYDCSEVPMTHFKPGEIGAPIKKLNEIGYTKDIHGNPLVSSDQVVEIKPQDIVIPACRDMAEEPADLVLLRVTQFIDELLEKMYGLPPYYNCKTREDLIGQLVIGLAPHTSAGILTRVIGFSNTQGFFAHPMIHAAMRRDTDGDESCFFLLLDGFLNFSQKFLPSSTGSTMDAPLVLTTKLIPSEVDDMVFDMETSWKYPLEFYNACENFKMPWDIKLEQLNDNLDTPKQYEGFGFTHPTITVNAGIFCSAYKTLPSMQEKLMSQMNLAEKLCAVDESDVATLVIDKHFMKDLKGNLRKFSQQQFRCVKCNEKYRRPPLKSKCQSCGGKVIFTISEGSVGKYLEPSISLAKNYHVSPYLSQSIDLLKERFESVFGKEKEKQSSLGAWFG
jgi:DNA polymerase II large subunit